MKVMFSYGTTAPRKRPQQRGVLLQPERQAGQPLERTAGLSGMEPPDFQIAQANVALMRAPLDHPSMSGFIEGLAEVNRLADAAPGFVWRYQTEAGDATAVRVFDDQRILLNLSVWESTEALRDFAYSGAHLEYYRSRADWFEPLGKSPHVMWWVATGERPTPEEGRRRLERLWREGPRAAAQGVRNRQVGPEALANRRSRVASGRPRASAIATYQAS
jgi:hypothetical protein